MTCEEMLAKLSFALYGLSGKSDAELPVARCCLWALIRQGMESQFAENSTALTCSGSGSGKPSWGFVRLTINGNPEKNHQDNARCCSTSSVAHQNRAHGSKEPGIPDSEQKIEM
jgi:hypothetical protein